MPVVSLEQVTKSFETQTVVKAFSLDIRSGEFLTLLGPSGSGKTTVLRIIAGLETCDSGRILINGMDQTRVPACERDVNTVFQSYALFPHMNVFDNVAFGLSLKKVKKQEIAKQVGQTLELLRLEGFDKRRIHQLSGGQQQRVAIARAIVNRPLILLFDEPLSALDHKLRKEMRMELRRLHRSLGITFVFVTHDQEEALTLSDRVVVMNNGRIEQIGSPKDVYEEPKNFFVADFIGESNFFHAEVIKTVGPEMIIKVQGIYKKVANPKGFSTGDQVLVLLRPEDMTIETQAEKQPSHSLYGHVVEMVYKGMTVELIIRLESGKMISILQFFNEDAQDIHYDPGQPVFISWYEGWEVLLKA